ncbi:hypothetical protein J5226_12475 [Lysobacter sp. K5869]|uniref:hypothetical protein n=1 Tax=Lysobacter sp. K5869 TaxID=2820808 RepID=UPI001C06238E|nr:hypothetical protein [Lysobacter sp. K5869]QWP79147.1 hypothetical protein J5226_12475 [Lysobacter sp. K5869]
MRLPATLAPWRQWLDWFDPDLAGALGDVLLRLHPLLGAFRLRALRGRSEPEGIDDLRRRGSYERLLLSEWALADAAPEEFDRRAAGGEHLFLSPKLIARQADALTVAVFDNGPAQLGAPRLLHMALWILLAQRAQAAKARFLWGVLSAPGELFEADSEERLRELLSARTWRFGESAGGSAQARAALEQEWARCLDGLQPSPSERWSIGAPGAGHGLGHRVGIGAAQTGELTVTVSAASARREATLALPDPARAKRLLHGLFVLQPGTVAAVDEIGPVRVVRVARKISLKQPPLLSPNGLSVAVPLLNEHAAHLHRLAGRRRLEEPHHAPYLWSLVAATIHTHRLGACLIGDRQVEFRSLPGFARGPLPPQLNHRPERGRWLPMIWVQPMDARASGRHKPQPELFLLHAGALWRWRSQDAGLDPQTFAPFARDVLAIAPMHEAWVDYLRLHGGSLQIGTSRNGHGQRPVAQVDCAGEARSGWLAVQRVKGLYRHVAAVELRVGGHGGDRAGAWRVLQWDNGAVAVDFEIILPSEWKVIGVDAPRDGGPALIAINPDRTALLSLGEKERRTLYRSAARLSVGSVAGGGETIALIDLDGRLVVLHERGASITIYAGGEGDG